MSCAGSSGPAFGSGWPGRSPAKGRRRQRRRTEARPHERRILQPFYLPYCGVFELVRMADVFVFYDDVKVSRQNWQSRNPDQDRAGNAVAGRASAGVDEATIRESALNEDDPWRRKHRKAVEQAYSKAEHRALVLDTLGPLGTDAARSRVG